MNYERPTWEKFDSLKSIAALGKLAVTEMLDKIDTRYADAINDDEKL